MFDAQTALDFVNTRLDRPAGRVESLGDRDSTTAWLEATLGYQTARRLTESEFAALIELRDSALALARARVDGLAPPEPDLERINSASLAAPRADQLSAEWGAALTFGSSRSSQPGIFSELGGALASAVITLLARDADRLAECGADDCVVLFLRSDPRRRWHSDRCGNRVRAARNYARQKADTQSA